MNDEEERRPRWREDFPIKWEGDHYVSRRELAKFMTLGSALLVGANVLIAVGGPRRHVPSHPRRQIPNGLALAPGASLQFFYPTDADPCLLVRRPDGELVAYSQVCTHLSCAVVHAPGSDSLFCPCHLGEFSCAEGRPTAGPPERPLPRILLQQVGGELFATGVQV